MIDYIQRKFKRINKEKMKGKTIKNYKIRGIDGHDDEPYLDIFFTDGTMITITGGYGGYTGHSEDEYRQHIIVGKIKKIIKNKNAK